MIFWKDMMKKMIALLICPQSSIPLRTLEQSHYTHTYYIARCFTALLSLSHTSLVVTDIFRLSQ